MVLRAVVLAMLATAGIVQAGPADLAPSEPPVVEAAPASEPTPEPVRGLVDPGADGGRMLPLAALPLPLRFAA